VRRGVAMGPKTILESLRGGTFIRIIRSLSRIGILSILNTREPLGKLINPRMTFFVGLLLFQREIQELVSQFGDTRLKRKMILVI